MCVCVWLQSLAQNDKICVDSTCGVCSPNDAAALFAVSGDFTVLVAARLQSTLGTCFRPQLRTQGFRELHVLMLHVTHL